MLSTPPSALLARRLSLPEGHAEAERSRQDLLVGIEGQRVAPGRLVR